MLTQQRLWSLQWRHMGVMAYFITINSIDCWICYLGCHNRKYQSSASLALCESTGRFSRKGPVIWKACHTLTSSCHHDVIKWKHFPRYWPFERGNHRSPVNSPHKGQWRGALMFSLICAWINAWVNNREAGDLRRHRAHYDVIVTWGRELGQPLLDLCSVGGFTFSRR